MRPHRLTMKAFGPFAKETTVDFDAMGDSIYLIAGDIGAGKTTIFDAIIYALYGKASGDGRSGLSTESFHSDFAKSGKKREDMWVVFSFSNGGRTFKVTRHMFWGKSGEAQKTEKESWLEEGGTLLTPGKGREDRDDVTQKVTELLGLDADQFRRIVMLAQGEFRRFLEAGSDEREAILGKLYDNRLHRDLQVRLKAAKNLLEQRLRELDAQQQAQIALLWLPEDFLSGEREKLTAVHPDLITALENLNGRMAARLVEKRKELAGAEEVRKELADQKTAAQYRNGQLEELEKSRLRIRKLEEDEAALASLEEESRKKAEQLSKEGGEASAALQRKIGLLEQLLPVYEKRREARQQLRQSTQAYAAAMQRVKSAQEQLAEAKEKSGVLEKVLADLDHAGEAECAHAAEQERFFAEQVRELEQIRADIDGVNRLSAESEELKKQLSAAQNAAQLAGEQYLNLHRAFIGGQAGILASDLRARIEKEGQAACPVCGTMHTAQDAAQFAPLSEDTPGQQEVDRALARREKAEKAEKAAQEACIRKESECAEKKNALLKQAEKHLGLSGWKELEDGRAAASAAQKGRRMHRDAELALEKALRDRKDKETAALRKKQAEEAVAAAEKEAESAAAQQQGERSRAEIQEAGLKALEEQLAGYPAEADQAAAQISAARAGIAEWAERAQKAGEEYRSYSRRFAECRGNLGEAKEQTAKLEEVTREYVWTDLKDLDEKLELQERTLSARKEEAEAWGMHCAGNALALDRIRELRAKAGQLRGQLKTVAPLSDSANGNYAFSRYVLNDFFRRIVDQANRHLDIMTDGEYSLAAALGSDGRRNVGLDLRVRSNLTMTERDTATLSGGQSFEAALSLALGLSDVVQMESTSRIRIDSMFIDEGFGTLDGAHLDRALEVLSHLHAGTRQIGIISHVDKLEECLPKKIRVISGPEGSRVEIETDI